MGMAKARLERITSGIGGLDQVLRGGFIKGGLYILEGAPGTGKTILGNQISFHHAKAGSSILYVTLIAETVGRMLLNLGNMHFFDESIVGAGIFYISGFNALKNEGLTGLLHLLRREVVARQAAILVIDGFASAADSAHSPEELKMFVQQLQTQADAADCTVFLLTNPVESAPSSEETMVEGIINLGSALCNYGAVRELHVRKFRGSSCLDGVHNYHIGESGITVYPRTEARLRHLVSDDGRVRRITSGIPSLDLMIGGGIPERTMTMMVGPSGSGKTTVGLQFLANATRDEPGLLFGFYEGPARIRTKARMFPAFAQALDAGNVELVWQPPSEWVLDELATRLLEAVRRRNIRRLMIDGLAGFRKALRSRPMEPFFAALVEELCSLGVTTMCTAEAAEIIGPTITAPLGGLSDVTDNHILLRFVEVGARLYRILSILKVRDSSFDSNLREFSITEHGIDIAADSGSAELVLTNLHRLGPQELNVRQDK